MFAVIKTGGKQYKVATDDVITIEKLAGEAGSTIVFDTVLMLVNEAGTQVGAPTWVPASLTSMRTVSNTMVEPASPASFSIVITSSVATLYCLPPVLITANIVFSVFFPRLTPNRLAGMEGLFVSGPDV